MQPISRPRAILFDLFNTLIPGGSREERDEVSRSMAEALGVEPWAFADLVRSTFDDRARGRLGDLRESVISLARRLGATPSSNAVDTAVELRLRMTRALHARTWALPSLVELGRAGILRGLVSDCSAETPAIWTESPLSPHVDAVSFSCQTGSRKPEPDAYLAATAELGVEPNECFFVGDGGSNELTGAETLGMSAMRFIPPDDSRGYSIDEDTHWSEDVITDIMDLVQLLR